VSMSELHNGLELLLSSSKFKIDVANIIGIIMTGKQSSYCCIHPAPLLFVLQVTRAGCGGLETRLNVSYVQYIACANYLRSSIGVT